MEFTQHANKMQAPAGLNLLSIPSPMHSSSRVQRVATETQQQTVSPRKAPHGLQLPEQIFAPQPEGFMIAENLQCVTPSDTMMQCGTPLAIATPSNVATTHWRTTVCPGAPMHPTKCQASRLQRFGSNDTPVSSISPGSQWPSRPPTPHRLLSFDSSSGHSMPATPTGMGLTMAGSYSVPSTPTGIGLNTAFIATTPVHEGDVTMFDEDVTMFGQPVLGRHRSLSAMSMGSEATPRNSAASLMRGSPLMIPQQKTTFSRLLSM